MPIQARRDYIALLWEKYQAAVNRAAKSTILDEICRNLDYDRTYACKLMNKPSPPKNGTVIQRQKSLVYDDIVKEHVRKLWRAMNRVGGKKLVAAMPDWLPFYDCAQPIKQKLYTISASQIDRILKPVRAQERRKKNTGTVPAQNHYRTEIPLRPLGKVVRELGFMEIDTVAHCGDSMAGHFMWSLTAVDLCSGWVQVRGVWGKEGSRVKDALEDIESKLPFKLRGLFSDNGTEFLNSCVIEEYVRDPRRTTPLKMARGRSYHSNDQAHVEQRNNTHVRNLLGYGRIGSQSIVGLVNLLYEDWCELQNFFMPQVKLIQKERIKSKVKRIYSAPVTPFERLLESNELSNIAKEALILQKSRLNPFELMRRIRTRLQKINQTLDIHKNLRGRTAS